MKKIKIVMAALVLALLLSAGGAAAFTTEARAEGGSHNVVYRLNGFSSRTDTVADGGKASAHTVADFHGSVGEGGIAAASVLKIDWYTDAAFTEAYDFDTAVTEDITLYGKMGETARYGESDAYGWSYTSGIIYVGEPRENQVLSSDKLCSPLSVDSADGTAFFSFASGDYCVYYRGFDVTKPFTVTADFGSEAGKDELIPYFVDLFPSLSLAQAGTMRGPEDYGAMASTRIQVGKDHYAYVSNNTWWPIPSVYWLDTDKSGVEEQESAAMKAALDTGKLVIEYNIGADSSYATVNGVRMVEFGCKRSDFPQGRAYMSTGIMNGSLEVNVTVGQQLGKVTATVKEGNDFTVTAAVNNGFVIAEADIDGKYDLKAEIDGKAVKVESLGDGKYAVALTEMLTEDFEIVFFGEKNSSSSGKKGCKGTAMGACVPAAVLMLGLACGVMFARRKKGVDV